MMQVPTQSVRPISSIRSPTMIFLTAKTSIYTIGYGITMDVGTRLALQLILDKVFKLLLFQLKDLEKSGIVIYYH